MDNAYDTMRAAVQQVRLTMNAADGMATEFARLLEGRLRKVNYDVLKRLKRELRAFDSRDGRWKY